MEDPQVTIGFNTKSWSSMTWMIWGYPHDLENPYTVVYVQESGSPKGPKPSGCPIQQC